FLIMDEQRLVGSGAWSKAFIHMTKPEKKNTWILLSATPGDTWMDYIPVFIANGFYKNRTEFIQNHVEFNSFTKFPKIERFHGEGKLERLRNEILVHMPFERHTTRITHNVRVEYDLDALKVIDRKSTRLNSSHVKISYAVFCLKNISIFYY